MLVPGFISRNLFFFLLFFLKKNLLYHPTNLLRLAVFTNAKEFYKIPIFYDHEFLKEQHYS